MTRRLGLIALVALAVLVGAWYGLALKPEQGRIAKLRAQESQAQQQVSTLQVQYDGLKLQKADLGSYRRAMSELEEDVPQGPSLDQLIKTVVDAAASSSVKLTSLGTPEPGGWGEPAGSSTAPSGPGPLSISVSIGITGSDAGALAFLTALEAQPRLYVVDSFALDSAPKAAAKTAAEASGINTYTISVTGFYVSAASNSPVYPGTAP